MNKRVIVILVVFLATLINGCIETPKESISSPSITVPPVPKQIYLHPGAMERFNFWGHNVSVNYLLQNSSHNVEITIDDFGETFIKSITEQCNDCAYGKKIGNITYVIRPVTWRTNEAGEKVWEFNTWNTRELYFEMVIDDVRSK